MPTTRDVKSYSTRILGTLQQLDELLDEVANLDLSAGEPSGIADRSHEVLHALTAIRTDLLTAGGEGPAALADPRRARRGIAIARAELPLEPALEALRALPGLIDKARTHGATSAVLLVPLVLAYRHALDALRPLVEDLDPNGLAGDPDSGPA